MNVKRKCDKCGKMEWAYHMIWFPFELKGCSCVCHACYEKSKEKNKHK